MQKSSIVYTEGLSVGYKSKTILENINLALPKGKLACLLGPNGAGKSTLIRTLAGLQAPKGGKIYIEGEEIRSLTAEQKSKKVGVVLTDKINIDSFSVFSVIALGRYPYTGWLGRLSQRDEDIIQVSLKATGLEDFKDRNINELSDGERQRVMIARALAQESPLMILDEPTAYIDLPGKIETMRLLRSLAKDFDKSIILSTHDLELSLEVADQLWLIKKDASIETGLPEDLILNGSFGITFNRGEINFDLETGKFKILRSEGRRIKVSGENVPLHWTQRALEREGYTLVNADYEMVVEIVGDIQNLTWKVKGSDRSFLSIFQLLEFLETR